MFKPFIVFSKVSNDEFCRILNYKYAKEAWDTLTVTMEGTSIMKLSKLPMGIIKFEIF